VRRDSRRAECVGEKDFGCGVPGVHTVFGPGLLESAYTACLVHELRKLGIDVKMEVPVPIVYEGVS